MTKIVALSIAVAFVALATGAKSCGTTDTKSTPDTVSSETSSSSTTSQAKRAGIGDALTLKGQDSLVQVRVVRVGDPIRGGQYDSPSSGSHFVGVFVSIKNVGTGTYSDAPTNSAKLITNTDEQANSAPTITEGDCGGSFSTDIKLAPGELQQGCLPFEVKDGQTPKTFQFTPDSGFGQDNGEWRLTAGP